jgi:hypothetical protein
MKTSIDKICTEEFEANGIYAGRQIKPYMHAAVTCNRLAILCLTFLLKTFSHISNTFELIITGHKTRDNGSTFLHTTTLTPRGREVLFF